MLRILNYGYTNHRQQKTWMGNFVLYLFFHKFNLPSRRNTKTSLGILRVKPEVFHFFSRFFFIYLHYPTKLSYPNDDKIDSWIGKCWTQKFVEGCESRRGKFSPESNIYWWHFHWCSSTFGNCFSCFHLFLLFFFSLSLHFKKRVAIKSERNCKRNNRKKQNETKKFPKSS